ncbi:hypothetical protein [Burkholderia gladioli]|uniref:hypothetical protein n=1 Tax=Burkholderia gladioli TaxID=28095 RepID=UPI001640E8E2|nr:hypothetical protein [Burkholderia gladioli]
MEISDIRLKNFRHLKESEGSGAALARRLDMAYALLQNYIGKNPTKKIGDKTARRVEEVLGLERGWMDCVHEERPIVETATRAWPFSVDRYRFDALPARERERVDRFIRDTVEDWERTGEQPLKVG